MNITFAVIRPSFALRLLPSGARASRAHSSSRLFLLLRRRDYESFSDFFLAATERNVPREIRIRDSGIRAAGLNRLTVSRALRVIAFSALFLSESEMSDNRGISFAEKYAKANCESISRV